MAGLLYETLFATNASISKATACILSSDYDNDKYEAQKVKIRIIEESVEPEAIKLKEAEDGKIGLEEEHTTE